MFKTSEEAEKCNARVTIRPLDGRESKTFSIVMDADTDAASVAAVMESSIRYERALQSAFKALCDKPGQSKGVTLDIAASIIANALGKQGVEACSN